MTRRRLDDDTGASLIVALVIITVFSLIVAAILSFGDSSIRTTMALRAQVAVANSAEGAGQIAINELRRSTVDASTGQCFGATQTLTLNNFYQPASGPADSAVVTCALDAAHSGVTPVSPTKPRNAILTRGTAGTEDGVRTSVSGGRTMKVHGGIFANSAINSASGTLGADAAVIARGACSGTITSVPAPTCTFTTADVRGDDPLYLPPGGAPVARDVPECIADKPLQLVDFPAGVYTDIDALNVLSRCPRLIMHFHPGIFYFAFSLNKSWDIKAGSYLVGGTETAGHTLADGTAPSLPGACEDPVPPEPAVPGWTPPAANRGVEFVFGGTSRITVSASSQIEICGNYSATEAPIALYGLKNAVGTVTAQSGCVTAVPPATDCAVISTDATTEFTVHGTGYLPNAALNLAFVNTRAPLFGYGVIARTVQLTPAAGADLSRAVISIPSTPPNRTVVYLTVYLCPGAATCTTTTGQQRIRAKVGLGDPIGAPVAGARWITVYSWSVLR